MKKALVKKIKELLNEIDNLPLDDKVKTINKIRHEIHLKSPFKNEPVDYVKWVSCEKVQANDYNPNVVAPPEMKLLELSIEQDGYTQPIVTWYHNLINIVVDGFHRNRVGKENIFIKNRIKGYLPTVTINKSRKNRNDRISSTIRHNRARGKHNIDGMSEIVIELKKRNWTEQKIASELGMEPDEILRLCQISGLSELFSDQEFSKSWDIEMVDDDFDFLSDDIDTYGEETKDFRTLNTNNDERIFHPARKWECLKAGLYKSTKEGMSAAKCKKEYCDFLSDSKKFAATLNCVINEWKFSCEHYLTNNSYNRIAWLGQAAMCYATGIPAAYRGGFNLLPKERQKRANQTALVYLNKWLKANGRKEATMDEALSNSQMDLY